MNRPPSSVPASIGHAAAFAVVCIAALGGSAGAAAAATAAPAAIAAPVPPAAAPPERTPAPPALAADLDAAFAAAGVPGAAVALVDESGVTFRHTYGEADTGRGHAVDTGTLFRAGSVSKVVTAIVVQQLVAEGRLSLDDRVADRAPWLRIRNPWEGTHPLRIVHLLEHTTGWADLSPREFALDEAAMGARDALAVGGVRASRYPPGLFHAYTSAGYGVVGAIVEDIEGKPFAQVARERVFEPLGMASATFDLPAALAVSYLPDGDALAPQRYPLAAAAGLVLDIDDLARLARFLVDGRADDGRALLPLASLQRMEHAETTLAATLGVPHGYGLGNAPYVGDAAVLRGHGGSIDGFEAELRYSRDCRCGFALLANGSGVPAAAITMLERQLAAAPSRTEPLPDPATIFPDLAAFAGIYQPTAQRNRLMVPLDALATFARGEPLADGRFRFQGVDRLVDPRGRLRRPDRIAPTLALVRRDGEALIVGPTSAWKRVPGWTVAAKAAWAIALATATIAAFLLVATAPWRRRPGRLAWQALAALLPLLAVGGVFVVSAGLAPAASIAAFGTAGGLSITLFIATLAIPVAAAVILWKAWRGSGAGRTTRVVAAAIGVLLLVASAWLASVGWLGLRTWAI